MDSMHTCCSHPSFFFLLHPFFFSEKYSNFLKAVVQLQSFPVAVVYLILIPTSLLWKRFTSPLGLHKVNKLQKNIYSIVQIKADSLNSKLDPRSTSRLEYQVSRRSKNFLRISIADVKRNPTVASDKMCEN